MRSLLVSSTLLLTFAVFANAYPRHPMPPHKIAAKDTCLKKLDLTEDKLHQSTESDDGKDRGCFIACVDKELGLMTAEGNIDREAALKEFPPFISLENRTKIVDACLQQKGADDCETGKLYHDCVEKMQPHPPLNPELLKIRDNCMEKLSISHEDLEKMRQMPMEETKKDCFLACLAKGTGYLTEDGRFNKEAFLQKAPPHMQDEVQKVAEDCANEEGADECETIVLLQKCFRKNHFKIADVLSGPHPPRPNQGE